jgi:hypothetical protein
MVWAGEAHGENAVEPIALPHERKQLMLMAQQSVGILQIAGIMGDNPQTIEKHYLKHHPDYLKETTSTLEQIYA